METCKKILAQANIVPRLHLVRKKEGGGTEGTGIHRVKLLGDKACKVKNYKTQEVEYGIELLVEEDGEKKKYTFPMKNEVGEIHYLVEKMSSFDIGDEVIMEYKRQPGAGARGMIDVILSVKKGPEENKLVDLGKVKDIKDEDIPVLEEEDYGAPPAEFFGKEE